MTLNDIPLYGTFTTGPANTWFVRVSISGTPNAINLESKKALWIPLNRVVSPLNMKDFKSESLTLIEGL